MVTNLVLRARALSRAWGGKKEPFPAPPQAREKALWTRFYDHLLHTIFYAIGYCLFSNAESDFTDLRSNPSPIRSRAYQTWTLSRTSRVRLNYLL